MPYKSGQVTVTTTATQIAAPGSVPEHGLSIYNAGAVAVFVGPSNVTATTGYQIPATTGVVIPTTAASSGEVLYGITASSTAVVSYLFPG